MPVKNTSIDIELAGSVVDVTCSYRKRRGGATLSLMVGMMPGDTHHLLSLTGWRRADLDQLLAEVQSVRDQMPEDKPLE